jgi:hypothetical protein
VGGVGVAVRGVGVVARRSTGSGGRSTSSYVKSVGRLSRNERSTKGREGTRK